MPAVISLTARSDVERLIRIDTLLTECDGRRSTKPLVLEVRPHPNLEPLQLLDDFVPRWSRPRRSDGARNRRRPSRRGARRPFQPPLDAGEAPPAPSRIASTSSPHAAADRDRRERVAHVVGAEQRQLELADDAAVPRARVKVVDRRRRRDRRARQSASSPKAERLDAAMRACARQRRGVGAVGTEQQQPAPRHQVARAGGTPAAPRRGPA